MRFGPFLSPFFSGARCLTAPMEPTEHDAIEFVVGLSPVSAAAVLFPVPPASSLDGDFLSGHEAKQIAMKYVCLYHSIPKNTTPPVGYQPGQHNAGQCSCLSDLTCVRICVTTAKKINWKFAEDSGDSSQFNTGNSSTSYSYLATSSVSAISCALTHNGNFEAVLDSDCTQMMDPSKKSLITYKPLPPTSCIYAAGVS